MDSKLIKTIKKEPRDPKISFFLSLLFTGLGQIYNGELLKGFVFITLRLSILMILPLYMTITKSESYIYIFTAVITLTIFIILASPIESIYKSFKFKNISLKKFNSITFYIFFVIINSLTLLFAIFIIKSIFDIKKITDLNTNTIIENGDYILTNKFNIDELKGADLIIYNNNLIGRVIATEGDFVKFKSKRFFVNNIPLKINILSEDELQNFSTGYNENLLSETNDSRKYPIIAELPKRDKLKPKFFKIKKSFILVANDNRLDNNFYSVIPVNKISERVDGIIFSWDFCKILSLPFWNIE